MEITRLRSSVMLNPSPSGSLDGNHYPERKPSTIPPSQETVGIRFIGRCGEVTGDDLDILRQWKQNFGERQPAGSACRTPLASQ